MIVREIADAIFGPLLALLDSVLSWLSNLSLTAWHGLDPAVYLGPFAWLPAPWLSFIKSVILAAAVFGVLLVSRAGYALYLDIKQGVKWW